MDGYALRSADTAGASPAAPARLAVAGRVAAGHVAERAAPARARPSASSPAEPCRRARIASSPRRTSAWKGRRSSCRARSRPATTSGPRGEDVRAGDGVLEPGRLLGPAGDRDCSPPSAASQVRVIRRPRVGILSTGDEIVDLGGRLGPGQIPNSNTYSLMAQVSEAGGEPVSLGVAADRLDDIEARFRWGLGCDLVISSAGVSVGEHDFVKAALERLGAEQHLWLVDMRPGQADRLRDDSLGGQERAARLRAAGQSRLGHGHLRALRAPGAPAPRRSLAARAPAWSRRARKRRSRIPGAAAATSA